MIDFDQIVEYVTEGPVIHRVPLEQCALDSLLTLAELKDALAHVTTLGRAAELDANELDALKATAPYHQDVIDNEITSSDPVVIIDALIAVRSRPEWYVGLQCEAADVGRTKGVYFNPADGNLYRCILAHKAQADWRPDLPGVAALWIRFYEPEAGPQPWVQPYGGSGTYISGAIVTHNGQTWRNIVPAPTLNVWEPGVYGWEVVT